VLLGSGQGWVEEGAELIILGVLEVLPLLMCLLAGVLFGSHKE